LGLLLLLVLVLMLPLSSLLWSLQLGHPSPHVFRYTAACFRLAAGLSMPVRQAMGS
jgi:hypothetical protein